MMPAKKNPFWVAILITVIAVFILGLALIYFPRKEEEQSPKSPQSVTNEGSPFELNEKQNFSYVGKVESITDKGFTILASAARNPLEKDTLITVKTTSGTKYTEMSVPVVLPSDIDQQSLNELFKVKEISFSGLNVGDEVTVVSQTNTYGKTSMEASKVQKTSLVK